MRTLLFASLLLTGCYAAQGVPPDAAREPDAPADTARVPDAFTPDAFAPDAFTLTLGDDCSLGDTPNAFEIRGRGALAPDGYTGAASNEAWSANVFWSYQNETLYLSTVPTFLSFRFFFFRADSTPARAGVYGFGTGDSSLIIYGNGVVPDCTAAGGGVQVHESDIHFSAQSTPARASQGTH